MRGETFVTRKITRGAGAHPARPAERLYLGNLDARATGAMPATTCERSG